MSATVITERFISPPPPPVMSEFNAFYNVGFSWPTTHLYARLRLSHSSGQLQDVPGGRRRVFTTKSDTDDPGWSICWVRITIRVENDVKRNGIRSAIRITAANAVGRLNTCIIMQHDNYVSRDSRAVNVRREFSCSYVIYGYGKR